MAKYRERAWDTGAATATATATAPSNSTAIPAYASLAEQYGLTDMFGTPEDVDGQTLEQEYQAYVTAALSKQGTVMLKFWEAHNLCIISLIY
jgi:hypothetical protein